MLCIIDNYDSFTYNIVHYLNELGINVHVILNDEMSANDVFDLKPTHIILSPGPGTPNESGISKEVLTIATKNKLPTLGICLGHEIICQVFGCNVNHAKKVMHGKPSKVYHSNNNLFSDIPSPFIAARYHSLIIEKNTIPDCLNITAWTINSENEVDEIMGIAHKTLPIFGVQFHPESIMSECGHNLLSNFIGNSTQKRKIPVNQFSNLFMEP